MQISTVTLFHLSVCGRLSDHCFAPEWIIQYLEAGKQTRLLACRAVLRHRFSCSLLELRTTTSCFAQSADDTPLLPSCSIDANRFKSVSNVVACVKSIYHAFMSSNNGYLLVKVWLTAWLTFNYCYYKRTGYRVRLCFCDPRQRRFYLSTHNIMFI